MSAALEVIAVLPGPFGALACADSIRDQLPGARFVTGWLAPDVTSTNQVIADLALLIQYVVESGGSADMLNDRTGVAVWHHSARPLPPLASLRRCSVDAGYAERVAALEQVVHDTVPAATAHSGGQLLVLFAVAAGPGHTGAQRAAALLDAHHTELDAAERPASTATFSASVRWLLARHGWTAGARGRLPGGTAWWPMHRLPRTTAANVTSTG